MFLVVQINKPYHRRDIYNGKHAADKRQTCLPNLWRTVYSVGHTTNTKNSCFGKKIRFVVCRVSEPLVSHNPGYTSLPPLFEHQHPPLPSRQLMAWTAARPDRKWRNLFWTKLRRQGDAASHHQRRHAQRIARGDHSRGKETVMGACLGMTVGARLTLGGSETETWLLIGFGHTQTDMHSN